MRNNWLLMPGQSLAGMSRRENSTQQFGKDEYPLRQGRMITLAFFPPEMTSSQSKKSPLNITECW